MLLDALDLFSGAGGLTLGLEGAGWHVVGSVENDRDATLTHKMNFPAITHFDDVRSIDFKKFAGLGLIAGGPPCQPFSVSGKQQGAADERDMIPQFFRAVREARPMAFLMENVAGLMAPRFRGYVERFVASVKQDPDLSYDVYLDVLDAADFGVPQHRRRLFIVGVPRGTAFAFPAATHGKGNLLPYATVADALKGVPEDTPNLAKVVFAMNPVLRRSPYAGLLLNGKGRPLNPDAPSLTIPATAGGNRTHIIDPAQILVQYHRELMNGGMPRRGQVPGCRRLTLRECARIQSFPDQFMFAGKKSRQFSQVGNAVPPKLACAVAKAIFTAIATSNAARISDQQVGTIGR